MNYELLDDLLISSGMSRRKLALQAGIPPTTLQTAIEKKSQSFSIENMKKIASVLKVPWWIFADYEMLTQENFDTTDYQEISDLISDSLVQKLRPIISPKINELVNDLVKAFHALNNDGKIEAIKRVRELGEIPRYQLKKDESDS